MTKPVSTVGLEACLSCGTVLKVSIARRRNDGECPNCEAPLDP